MTGQSSTSQQDENGPAPLRRRALAVRRYHPYFDRPAAAASTIAIRMPASSARIKHSCLAISAPCWCVTPVSSSNFAVASLSALSSTIADRACDEVHGLLLLRAELISPGRVPAVFQSSPRRAPPPSPHNLHPPPPTPP